MTDLGSERIRDEALLIARILLAVLFLVFGWLKLTDYSWTVAYMTQSGAPLPSVAALVASVIEFFGAIALNSASGHGRWRCCSRSSPLQPG